MMNLPSPTHIKQLRAFNRLYTQRIGVLDPYLGSEFSLTEVRVLYELAHRDQPSANALARDLALDAGYLSRILRRFETKGWLARVPSPADARQSLLELTEDGHRVFAPLQQRSRDAAAALLTPLPEASRQEVMQAMATLQRALMPVDASVAPTRTVLLRDFKPGDIGWVVQQHGELYAREYGWNTDFEGLVASIAADFIKNYQPEWERCWIAELDDARVGSVFVVHKSKAVAQLRMLLLTPSARGLGLGARLTDECLDFARAKGYKKMVLWTNEVLTAARSIYAKRGFQLVHSEPHHSYGQDLVGETWEVVF